MKALRSILGRPGRLFVPTALAMLVLLLAACGGDDDGGDDGDSGSANNDPTAAATESSGDDGNADDGNADGGGGSVTAQFLERFFGLPPSFVTDSQRACMDAELSADFPNGLPADATFTEELVDKLDEAAATCNVAGLGS